MSTFAFGFSGDDIDAEDVNGDDGIAANLAEVQLVERNETEGLIPPQRHDLDDLVSEECPFLLVCWIGLWSLFFIKEAWLFSIDILAFDCCTCMLNL